MSGANNISDSDNSSHEEMERVCSILESIAKNYPESSDESLAIRDATMAYVTVFRHQTLEKSYRNLVDIYNGELPEHLKEDLRSRGIEPDDFEDDGD